MTAPLKRPEGILQRLSPRVLLGLGTVFTLAVGVLDIALPIPMSFVLFYLLAVGLVAWGAGRRYAMLLSLVSTVIIAEHDWSAWRNGSQAHWVMVWNCLSAFLIFCGSGWLISEVRRLTLHLERLVERRTAQWKAEAEEHRAIAARMAERELYYRAILETATDGFAVVDDTGHIREVNPAYCHLVGYSQEELCGMHVAQLDATESEQDVAARIAHILQTGGDRFETTLRRKNGQFVDLELSVSLPFRTRTEFMAFARDITERKQNEARLRAIITGVPIVLFAIDRKGIIRFEDGQGLSALGFRPGQHVGISAQEAYSRFPVVWEQVRRALEGEEFTSTIWLGSAVFACWYTPTRGKDSTVTGCIGVAMNVTERQRLEQQLLEISDREQARIGQEIHDGLCQQLVSLAFDATALQDQLASANRPEARLASRLTRFLDQAITEARRLSRGLFPIRIEAAGLCPALEELARTTGERFHLDCRFEHSEPIVVPDKTMATHLYRIAQEAVNNSVKHAKPQAILIRLRRVGNQLELRVEDDGLGMVAAPDKKLSGLGFYIMEYRARSIGGRLLVEPAPESGTAIRCLAPCEPVPAFDDSATGI